MRRPLFALALLSLAAGALAADPEAPPGPSDDFLKAACDSGLLVQRDEKAPKDGDIDQDVSGFDDLAGVDEAAGADGEKKKAAPKPKTRLLRPKAADRDKCPDRMRAFYGSTGSRGLSAVLAPKDVPAEELRARADDAFAAMTPGSRKGERLADMGKLSKQDLDHRVEFADRLFDNAGPLASADFAGLSAKAEGLDRSMTAADKASRAAGALGTTAPGDAPPPLDPNAPPKAGEPPKAAPDAYTAAPGAGLPGGLRRGSKVPETRPVPAAREAWTGADNAAPPESGWLRQKYNDYSAAARDVVAGKPITTEMGWAPGVVNPFLHNTSPARLDGVAGVDRMLPNALAGVNRECARGSDPDYACWGTKDMVTILAAMGQKYDAYFKNIGGAKFRIGDISKRGGGYLSGHVSHQRGVDVDLRFVGGRGGFNVQANVMTLAALMLSVPNYRHIPGQQMVLVDQSLHPAIGAGLDRLVKENVITADEASRAKGALRHWPNHRDHFHLRIKLGDAAVAPQSAGPTPEGDQDAD